MSSTFIIPGCRSVRNLRSAFLAKGRRDRFALISKEKMLHFELSSCMALASPTFCELGTSILFLCRYAASILTGQCLRDLRRYMEMQVLSILRQQLTLRSPCSSNGAHNLESRLRHKQRSRTMCYKSRERSCGLKCGIIRNGQCTGTSRPAS